MSGALRRKKKKSRWGADLEAENGDAGVGSEKEALDAPRDLAESRDPGPDPASSNWRTAEETNADHTGALQSRVSTERTGLTLIGAHQ